MKGVKPTMTYHKHHVPGQNHHGNWHLLLPALVHGRQIGPLSLPAFADPRLFLLVPLVCGLLGSHLGDGSFGISMPIMNLFYDISSWCVMRPYMHIYAHCTSMSRNKKMSWSYLFAGTKTRWNRRNRQAGTFESERSQGPRQLPSYRCPIFQHNFGARLKMEHTPMAGTFSREHGDKPSNYGVPMGYLWVPYFQKNPFFGPCNVSEFVTALRWKLSEIICWGAKREENPMMYVMPTIKLTNQRLQANDESVKTKVKKPQIKLAVWSGLCWGWITARVDSTKRQMRL